MMMTTLTMMTMMIEATWQAGWVPCSRPQAVVSALEQEQVG